MNLMLRCLLLLSVASWSLTAEAPSEPLADAARSGNVRCESLHRMTYVKHLKNLALQLLHGKELKADSVKFNVTQCFFKMSGLQEVILELRDYYRAKELPKAAKDYERELCNVSAHCLFHRARLMHGILSSDDETLKALAKITFDDARCNIEEHQCTKYPQLRALLQKSATSLHLHALFIPLIILSCLLHFYFPR